MCEQDPSLQLIDEGFVSGLPDFEDKYAKLVEDLKKGTNYIVIEIAYVYENNRTYIIDRLSRDVPDIEFQWLCFENNLKKANANARSRKDRDPEGHVRINESLTQGYTYPEGAVILPIPEIGR